MHERQGGVEASGGGRVRVSIGLRAWVSGRVSVELSWGVRVRVSVESSGGVRVRASDELRAGVRSCSHSHSDFVSSMPV